MSQHDQRIAKIKAAKHKAGVDPNDWHKVHPNLLALAEYTVTYCDTYNLPLVITRIIDEPIPGVSVSSSHDGRAFDISVKGWTRQQIMDFVDTVNEIFTIGAISLRDKQEREAVFEERVTNEKGEIIKERHLHLQVRFSAPFPQMEKLVSDLRSAS